MKTVLKRFILFLVVASFGFSVAVVTNSSGTVFAQDTAYKAGNSIKVGSDLYIYKGVDTRPNSALADISIYLPKDFSCGDKLVIDDPKTPGKIATRTTLASSNEGSPVIGSCKTDFNSQTFFTLIEITREDLCKQEEGWWLNEACVFLLINITIPLPAGKCYSKDGTRYTEISCPQSPSFGWNCLVAPVSPPGADYVLINCITGRSVNENGLRDCSSSSDTECQQADGQYRCWDGSTIPSDSYVITCPVNNEQLSEKRCVDSGGEWNDRKGKCTCEPPLKLKKKQAICVAPQQEENEDESIDGDFVETAITVDCEEKDSNGNATTLTSENCGIISYVVWGINILSAIAGLAIVGSIMVAGYQYMTARDNSGQVEAAKKRILWALIAFGMFLFMYALLNWLVPGGLGLT